MKEKLKFPGVPIYMNGRNYFVPSLSTRQYRENQAAPPVYANMPPVSGTLLWTKGLRERVADLMRRIDHQCRDHVDPEEFERVSEKHAELAKELKALDRARYFIPLATRTNLGLVQSSRMWATTVKHLDSLGMPEASAAAKAASLLVTPSPLPLNTEVKSGMLLPPVPEGGLAHFKPRAWALSAVST